MQNITPSAQSCVPLKEVVFSVSVCPPGDTDNTLLGLSEKVDSTFKSLQNYHNYKNALENSFKGYTGLKLSESDLQKTLKKLDDNVFANSPANDQYLNFISLLILNSNLVSILVDNESLGENKELLKKLMRKCRLKVENEDILQKLMGEYHNQNNIGLSLFSSIKLVLINPHSYINLLVLAESLNSALNSDFYRVSFDIIEMIAKKALIQNPLKISPHVYISNAHLLRGEIAKAIDICESLITKGFTDIELLNKILEIYLVCDLDLRCIEKGLLYSQKALLLYPDNETFKFYKQYFDIRIEILKKDFKKANQKIDKYYSKTDVLYLVYHSNLLVAEGHAVEAFRLYETKLKLLSINNPLIKKTLGLVYANIGKDKDAVDYLKCFSPLEYSIDTQSQILMRCKLLSKSLYLDAYFPEVEKLLLGILNLTPDCISVLLIYGRLKLEKAEKNPEDGSLDEILVRFEKASIGKSDFNLQLLMLSIYAIKENRYLGTNLAKEILLSITDKDLEIPFLMNKLAKYLVDLNLIDEAMKILDRSLKLKWDLELTRFYVNLLHSQGNIIKACEVLEDSLKASPKSFHIYSLLASFYTDLKRWSKVIKFANLSIAHKLEIDFCLKLRLHAHISLNKSDKSFEDVELILASKKGLPPNDLLTLFIDVHIQGDKLERAAEMCDQYEKILGKTQIDSFRDQIADRLKNRVSKPQPEKKVFISIPEKLIEKSVEKPIEMIKEIQPIEVAISYESEPPIEVIDEFQQFINLKKAEEIQYFEKLKLTQQYTKERYELAQPLPTNLRFTQSRCEEFLKKMKESNLCSNYTFHEEKKASLIHIRTSNLPEQKYDDKINEIPTEILQKTKDKYSPSSTMVQGYISINPSPTPPLSKEYQDRLELAKQRLISLGDILSRIQEHYNIKDELSNFVVRHCLLYNLMKLTEALYPTSQPQKVNGELKDFIDYVDLKLISKEFIHKIRNDVRNYFHSISFESLINLSTQLCESNLLKNIIIWLTNSKTNISPNPFENKVSDGKFTYFEMDEKKIMDPFAILIFQLDKINHIGTKLRKKLDSEGDHLHAIKMSVAIVKKCLKLIPNSQQLISKDDYKLFYNSGNAFAHFIGEDIVYGEKDEVSFGSIILMVRRAIIVKEKLNKTGKNA